MRTRIPASENRVAIRTAFDRIVAGLLTGADAAVRDFTRACGYSAAELAAVPPAANLGRMCGHPLRFADLQPGEVVLDLGCGGGLDVLLAARVAGRVVGIDLSPGMVERAGINGRGRGGSIEFRVADLEELPFEDESFDCVLSNNAFHYAESMAAFGEAFRVLKPGGRLAFCDLACKDSPPDEWCAVPEPVLNLRGVESLTAIQEGLRRVGFELRAMLADTAGIFSSGSDRVGLSDEERLNQWVAASQGCCGVEPAASVSRYHDALARLASRERLTTVSVLAMKPRT